MLLPQCKRGAPCRVFIIEFDKKVFEYLTLHANPPWVSALSERIGDLGSYTIPAIVFCVLYYWLNSPRFLRFVLCVVVLLALSEGAAYLIKITVARPRPAVEWLIYLDPKAVGFPSAHAVNSMALAFFLSRWFDKSMLWYLPLPLIIGASRVMANYHYPLDVIGGWLLGYAVAWLYWAGIQRLWAAHLKT